MSKEKGAGEALKGGGKAGKDALHEASSGSLRASQFANHIDDFQSWRALIEPPKI